MTRKPNLFIVGAPKCGTTSLRYYLGQHPDIWFDIDVEPNFFANDVFGFEDVTNEKEYLKFFKKARKQKYVGDKSPLHLYSKEAAKRIHDYSPEAKIIIIIRNPVEMIYSWHNHLLIDGIETIRDFKQALESEKKRKSNKVLKTYLYHDIVKYSEQIKRYFDVFGKENVKVLLFDELKKNPAKVYSDILQFLGLKKNKIDYTILNESKYTYKSYSIHRIIAFLRNSPLTVRRMVKLVVPYQVRDFIRSLNIKETEKLKPLDRALKKKLAKEFRSEVIKTEKILGKSLAAWKH